LRGNVQYAAPSHTLGSWGKGKRGRRVKEGWRRKDGDFFFSFSIPVLLPLFLSLAPSL
jgi:hypothetical protein